MSILNAISCTIQHYIHRPSIESDINTSTIPSFLTMYDLSFYPLKGCTLVLVQFTYQQLLETFILTHFCCFTSKIHKTNTVPIFPYPACSVSVVYIFIPRLLILQFYVLYPHSHFYVLVSRTPDWFKNHARKWFRK